MYLRHTTVTRNGKTHTYWRLLRSVRVGRRMRQETVTQLGELDAQGRVRSRRAFAESLVGVERRPGLFDDKHALEQHLQERLGTLFGLDYDLLLYDITSTYFEGAAAANPLAQRGYSRDHRPDCKQVLIGLVVTRDGYPLGYEVFAGNRQDGTTVKTIVTRMEARYGGPGRIWVLDRGMVSDATLDWLKARGSRYIVGTPRSRLREFADAVRHGGWEAIRDGLDVQRCADAHGTETFLLCRSADRAVKEQAMRERFVGRIEAGLAKIAAACQRQRCDVGKIERRVGRLLGRNTRAAGLFHVVVTRRADGGAAVRWSRQEAAAAWAQASQGCYVLRSNVADWEPAELWRAYLHLTDAEAAFRIHKSDLRLRPVWHQKARARASPHPGVLPGLRAAQDAGRLVGAGRLGQQPDDAAGRVRPHSEHRRGGADHRWPHGAAALRGPSRPGPDDPAAPSGPDAAAAPAIAPRPGRNVVPTLDPQVPQTRGISRFQSRMCGSWVIPRAVINEAFLAAGR